VCDYILACVRFYRLPKSVDSITTPPMKPREGYRSVICRVGVVLYAEDFDAVAWMGCE